MYPYGESMSSGCPEDIEMFAGLSQLCHQDLRNSYNKYLRNSYIGPKKRCLFPVTCPKKVKVGRSILWAKSEGKPGLQKHC